jgi:hypothetical protein
MRICPDFAARTKINPQNHLRAGRAQVAELLQ